MKLLKWLIIAVVLLAVVALAAGRLGLLQGRAPGDLGVHDGRLKPPSETPNSVSSQASLHTGHARQAEAQIAPLRYSGDGVAAMARLRTLVASTEGARIVTSTPDYLYATFTTPWMRFVDDVEFWLDPTGGVIQVRSASRLGERDFGANRNRVEALRQAFEKP